jgi:hypothetical protein
VRAARKGNVLHQVEFMATNKIEKASVGFGVGRQGGPTVIEVRLHHDTISALKGVQLGFELLNGISAAQAQKIVDVLNENVVGVVVSSASEIKTDVKKDDKTQAASG